MAVTYEGVFTAFLAQSGDFFFPYVDKTNVARQMSASEENVALKRAWATFTAQDEREEVAKFRGRGVKISASCIRKSIVTAFYEKHSNRGQQV